MVNPNDMPPAGMASGGGAIEQVPVLRSTGKDREVDLAIVIDGHSANECLG